MTPFSQMYEGPQRPPQMYEGPQRPPQNSIGNGLRWLSLLLFATLSTVTTYQGSRLLFPFPWDVVFTMALQLALLGAAITVKLAYDWRHVVAYLLLAAVSTCFSFGGVREEFDKHVRPLAVERRRVEAYERYRQGLEEQAEKIQSATLLRLETQLARAREALVQTNEPARARLLRTQILEIQARLREARQLRPAESIGAVRLSSADAQAVSRAYQQLGQARAEVEKFYVYLPPDLQGKYPLPDPPNQITEEEVLDTDGGEKRVKHPFVAAMEDLVTTLQNPLQSDYWLPLLIALSLDGVPLLIALWLRPTRPLKEVLLEKALERIEILVALSFYPSARYFYPTLLKGLYTDLPSAERKEAAPKARPETPEVREEPGRRVNAGNNGHQPSTPEHLRVPAM